MEINIIVTQADSDNSKPLTQGEKKKLIETHFRDVKTYCQKEVQSGRPVKSLTNSSLGESTLITTIISKPDYR